MWPFETDRAGGSAVTGAGRPGRPGDDLPGHTPGGERSSRRHRRLPGPALRAVPAAWQRSPPQFQRQVDTLARHQDAARVGQAGSEACSDAGPRPGLHGLPVGRAWWCGLVELLRPGRARAIGAVGGRSGPALRLPDQGHQPWERSGARRGGHGRAARRLQHEQFQPLRPGRRRRQNDLGPGHARPEPEQDDHRHGRTDTGGQPGQLRHGRLRALHLRDHEGG